MCRWYSNGIFHHLAKLGFKWVLRLDTDSEVRAGLGHSINNSSLVLGHTNCLLLSVCT